MTARCILAFILTIASCGAASPPGTTGAAASPRGERPQLTEEERILEVLDTVEGELSTAREYVESPRLILKRNRIGLLNLVNGLYLRKEQMKRLIEKARDALAIRRALRVVSSDVQQRVLHDLEVLDHILVRGAPIPKELEEETEELSEYDTKLQNLYLLLEKCLEKEVEGILDTGQKLIVEYFIPCVIPPPYLKDPVRAGQAGDSTPGRPLIRRIRAMSREEFDRLKKKLAEENVRQIEEETKLLGEEERARRRRIFLDTCSKARAWDDVTFEARISELTDAIFAENAENDLKNKLFEQERKMLLKPSKTGKYFLDPEMIGVLQDKLAAMSSFRRPERRSLDELGGR